MKINSRSKVLMRTYNKFNGGTMSETVKLIEHVVTWQGECIDSGRRMLLLRFKNCDRVINKKPCPWCDTLIKMRVSAEAPYQLKDIQKSIYDNFAGLMISGGEPLYNDNFDDTTRLLTNLKYPISNIETNGCNIDKFLDQSDHYKYGGKVRVIYSPKVFVKEDFDIEIERIEKAMEYSFFKNVYFKIVVDGSQITRLLIENICQRFNLNEKVYLMPQGKNREELIKNAPIVFDLADEFNTNISSREHLIYDFI